jgi:hypothetical protein
MNIFQHFFGIKFYFKNHTHIQGISQFEFARCFGFVDNLTYCLSKPANKFYLDAAVLAGTSAWLFDQIFDHMIIIRIMNCKILGPWQYAAPVATIQSFVSGAVGSHLPSCKQWVNTYRKDMECKMLFTRVNNPEKISKDSLKGVHYCYRQPLRSSHIIIEDEMLVYCELIWGISSYTQLQIVPSRLQNILFIAFHTNPIGGHLNANRTLHCLHLQYYWPKMFAYIQ